jgi:Phage Tail Collar Domain
MTYRQSSILILIAAMCALGLYFCVPPPYRANAQLGAAQTWAGTSGGTANAQTLLIHNVSALGDLLGVPIRFIAGNTNTNSATTTITINLDSGGALGPVTVNRPTSNIGLQILSGGEFQSGVMTEIVYDGTVFEIRAPVDYTPVGHTMDLRQSSLTAPLGYLLEDGSCYSRTTYAPLFSVIGTTYNAGAPSPCSGSQFAVPYSNGTVFVPLDNQGANTASRITNAISGCSATSVGVLCGNQASNILQTNLPNIALPVTDPGHSHTAVRAGGAALAGGSAPAVALNADSSTSTNTTGVTVRTGGSNTPLAVIQPLMIGLRAIKF